MSETNRYTVGVTYNATVNVAAEDREEAVELVNDDSDVYPNLELKEDQTEIIRVMDGDGDE